VRELARAFGQLLKCAVYLGVFAFVFALPLWAGWDYGPRALGAPRLDYLSIVAVLGLVGFAVQALPLIVIMGYASVKAFVANLPD
jgi:hypothetical protein